MKTAKSALLSTGDAALRLSVTPDTVLKWIKQGKIPAHKTAGGHHRIDVSVVDRMLSMECPLEPVASADARTVRCWEYFSVDGAVREECQHCAAHQVRAALCFELSRLDPAITNRRAFCATACEDCPYYQQVHRLPARVLAVTADKGLAELLGTLMLDCALVRVACDIYEASAEVGGFRPSVVLLDSGLPDEVYRTLRVSISADRRIPWVRVAVIGGSRGNGPSKDAPIFARESLREQLEAFLRERQVELLDAGEAGA